MQRRVEETVYNWFAAQRGGAIVGAAQRAHDGECCVANGVPASYDNGAGQKHMEGRNGKTSQRTRPRAVACMHVLRGKQIGT